MEGLRTELAMPTSAPAAELDAVTFATRFCSLLHQGASATEACDNYGVTFLANELEQLQKENPARTIELQSRWEATDKDL